MRRPMTTHAAVAQPLCILAADEDPERLDDLAAALKHLGHDVAPYAVRVDQVAAVVGHSDPDVAIVALHEDDGHALDLIEELAECASGPVIVALEGDDSEFVARAAARGIFAAVRPLSADSIQSAIEVAVRRYAEMQKLSQEVDRLESAIERRAIIERAKGILMERHGIDERAAFEMMRSRARASNGRVVDLARHVTESRGL
jgi:AmiR/NasT family two-component response regulator